MLLLQKRSEGGLLAGLWECPTSSADEAASEVEVATELLAVARRAASMAAAATTGGDAASFLSSHLNTLPISAIRPVGAPFVHMFSHIHRSVRVFGAKVDVQSTKMLRAAPPAAVTCVRTLDTRAQLHSVSRLASAGIPTLTRKVLCNAAAALGFVVL
jgi:hypothetical protein